jgi:hypothetical protein
MDLFLSATGYKHKDNTYAELLPKLREETVQFLFGSSTEPPPAWQTRLINKVLQNIWTTETRGNIESFSGEISSAVARQSTRQLQFQLIGQLYFEDLSDREYRITAAHQDTFHWLFAGPSDRHIRKWCVFSSWLQGSEKVYWITGKPGSGKSTLMKYLSRDSRTQENLLTWAGHLPLVTSHFYFWNSGTRVQMSLDGFYRTVVYTILSTRPEMAPEAFPDRWRNSRLFGNDTREWSVRELQQAFQILLKKSGRSYRLCLFIDGLDEYEGDHDLFVELLSDITATCDVKLCVASRPWPVFEAVFSTGAHLMLQDLTFPDIVRFTWSRLYRHRGFQTLIAMEIDYAGNLILEIAEKAQGVFLWVDLVTKSLLQGFRNADRVAHLRQRLEQLPGDLEDLYLKMFGSIDPFYTAQASQYFQLIMAGAGQLSALNFYFAEEEYSDGTLLSKIGPLTEIQRQAIYKTIKTRLGCCKGFLEIPNPIPSYEPDYVDEPIATSPVEPSLPCNDIDYDENDVSDIASCSGAIADPFLLTPEDKLEIEIVPEAERKITYLHRTAKDFLESPNMRKRTLSMSPPGYTPYLSILDSYLLMIKSLPVEKFTRKNLWHIILSCLEIAAVAESTTGLPVAKQLDTLDKTATVLFREHNLCEENRHWTTTRWTSPGTQHEVGFLPLAAEYNLKLYIASKLELGVPIFVSGGGRPILDFVIEDYGIYPSLSESLTSGGAVLPNMQVIKLLLARGEDPNFQFGSSTTWSRVLDGASRITKSPEMEDNQKHLLLEHWADIVAVFIAHEADPLVNRDSVMSSKIREIFGPSMPQRAKDLETQLKQTRRRWSSLKKFITPRNWKLEKLSLETTPLPILKRLESAVMAPREWSEFVTSTISDRSPDDDR